MKYYIICVFAFIAFASAYSSGGYGTGSFTGSGSGSSSGSSSGGSSPSSYPSYSSHSSVYVDCTTAGHHDRTGFRSEAWFEIALPENAGRGFNCSFTAETHAKVALSVGEHSGWPKNDLASNDDYITFACGTNVFHTLRNTQNYPSTINPPRPVSYECSLVNITVHVGAGHRTCTSVYVDLVQEEDHDGARAWPTSVCANNSVITVTNLVGPLVNRQPYNGLLSPTTPYPTNWNCTWILVPHHGHRAGFTIRHDQFSMQFGDSLLVTDLDAVVPYSIELNNRTTGGYAAAPVISTRGRLKVQFRTGPHNHMHYGFQLNLAEITAPTPPLSFCSGVMPTITDATIISNVVLPEDYDDPCASALVKARYPPNMFCKWHVHFPKFVNISTITIGTELNRDVVEIYDGAVESKDNLMARLTGAAFMATDYFVSSGQDVTIIFRSDAWGFNDYPLDFGSPYYTLDGNSYLWGFQLSIEPTDTPAPILNLDQEGCEAVTYIDAMDPTSVKNFSVGLGHADGYLPNLDCLWVFKLSEGYSITVTTDIPVAYGIGTSQTNDGVAFYNSESTSWETEHQFKCRMRYPGPVFVVRFTSDALRGENERGFSLSYNVSSDQPRCQPIDNFVPLPSNDPYSWGTFISGNLDPIFSRIAAPANLNCTWLLDPGVPVAITIYSAWCDQFNPCSRDPFGDRLVVYQGDTINSPVVYDSRRGPMTEYCDPIPSVTVSVLGPALIRFVTSAAPPFYHGTGLSFKWDVLPASDLCQAHSSPPFVEGGQYFFPPNLSPRGYRVPYLFSAPVDCTWTITAPLHHGIVELGIRPQLANNDRIIIYDGSSTSAPILQTFSGHAQSDIVQYASDGYLLPTCETMTIRFISPGSSSSVSFQPTSVMYAYEYPPFGFYFAVETYMLENGTQCNPFVNSPLCPQHTGSTIDLLAHLDDYINCTTIWDNIDIGYSSTPVSLPNLRRVEGNIQFSDIITFLSAPNLFDVVGDVEVTLQFPTPPMNFPSLRYAGRVSGICNGEGVASFVLPSLESAGEVSVCHCNVSFPLLQSARLVDVYGDGTHWLNLPLLSLMSYAYDRSLNFGFLLKDTSITSISLANLTAMPIFKADCASLTTVSAPKVQYMVILDLFKSSIASVDLTSLRYFTTCALDEYSRFDLPVRNLTLSSLQYLEICKANEQMASTFPPDFNMPSLKAFVGNFYGALMDSVPITRINLPSIRVFDLSVNNMGALQAMNIPAVRFLNLQIGYGNTALRPIVCPEVVAANLVVRSGNNKLKSLAFAAALFFGNIDLQSLDISSFSMPNVRELGALRVTQSRLTNISMPLLTTAGVISVDQSLSLSVLDVPLLRLLTVTNDNALYLKSTSLLTLNLKSLQVVGGGIYLESNFNLYSIFACRLQTVLGQVLVRASPQLSCQATRDMFQIADVVMTAADCNNDVVGSFGCLSNFTRVVNTTECGFTVACIQATIEASSSDADITVFVPSGTYRNCSSSLSFLGRALVLRGGGMASTVIDCEGKGSAFEAVLGEGPDTVLSDISFINGHAAGNGGAFRVVGASPTFLRVGFMSNIAGGSGGAGVVSGARPVFDSCVFSGNAAGTGGGGVFVTENASPTFTGCTFSSNQAGDYGGALAFVSAAASSLINVRILGNAASRGGGIYADGAVTVTGGEIANNTAVAYGGGVALVPIQPIGVSSVIASTSIHGNAASQGAGIYSYSATLSLITSSLYANVAKDSGGGLLAACSLAYRTLNGLSTPCAVYVNLTGGVISGNQAGTTHGGGVFAQNIQLTAIGTIVSSNTALGSGGGIYVAGTNLIVGATAQILTNVASLRGGGVACDARGTCAVAGRVSGNLAVQAGGGVYWCRSGCQTAGVPLAALTLSAGPTWDNNRVGDAGYGPLQATDPVMLSWLEGYGPQPTVISGFPLSAAEDQSLHVLIQDNYGQTVSSSIDVLQLTLRPATPGGPGLATLSGTLAVLATDGHGVFSGTRATAATLAATGADYVLRCEHTALGSVWLETTFALAACGPGTGAAAPESVEFRANQLVCVTCAGGLFSVGPDALCAQCTAGSFSTAGATACTPCAVDFYQPAPGATSCTPCPQGSHARGGAAECAQDDALAGVSAGAIAGAVSGTLLVLICAGVIIAVVVARYSRRKTMERYYLEEDATVRRGVKDSSLGLAMRKFITASTTTRIGGGQFTDIYKGRHEGAWIALKVVKGDAVAQGTAQNEFKREVVALSILNEYKHPAVVELRFFLERSPVCIGMAFYARGSLKRSLATLELTPAAKVRMAAQIASGLATLHALNIAHCDIKTDNVLLTEDNDVKLADFGICHVFGETLANLGSVKTIDETSSTPGDEDLLSKRLRRTAFVAMAVDTKVDAEGHSVARSVFEQTDSSAFTPQYVDPYRLKHDTDVSPTTLCRADVYSFGMLMWAIYSKEEPFAGIEPTLLAEQRRDRPEMRPAAIADCHPCYKATMDAACATQPVDRPTMRRCLDELCECLRTHFNATLADSFLAIPESVSTPADMSSFVAVDKPQLISVVDSGDVDSMRGGPPMPSQNMGTLDNPVYDSQLATGVHGTAGHLNDLNTTRSGTLGSAPPPPTPIERRTTVTPSNLDTVR